MRGADDLEGTMTKMTGARTGLAAMALAMALAAPGLAQDAFIQIEAKRSLAEGQEAVRDFAARVPDVSGFRAAGGWFVVALGPLPAASARAELARLRAAGAVPGDAFLTEGDLYRQRFWPAGTTAPAVEPMPEVAEIAAAPAPAVAQETLREAREAEAALSREEREAIQMALEWAGHYEGGIDAAFGRGTRRAMGEWQAARGLEATGVLTTAQRGALIAEWRAVFDGLGLERVEDTEAGIALEVPTERLAFEARETPFSRYEATDGGPGRLVLISREGDEAALASLFEVMQTLEMVPRGGDHSIDGDMFRLRGRDSERLVRGFARVRDGQIKGFLLAWPADEAERFERLWDRMRSGFERIEGVLGPRHETPAEAQRLDQLAGLEMREPTLARSGFFVDSEGAVLTTAEVADGACGEVLIDDAHPASVVWSDGAAALLRPVEPLAPPRIATLAREPGRLGSDVAVAGFPFGGALGRASLTRGSLEDLRGPEGDEALDRYALAFEAGDAGGPVLAPDGSVAGMLLPAGEDEAGRALPPGVALGIDAARLDEMLREAGVTPERASLLAVSGRADAEAEVAVLVTCHG